tara:strand:+ start:1748 stop:2158 length:411 start_codon:yes stop_codon:yes gene_type:complete
MVVLLSRLVTDRWSAASVAATGATRSAAKAEKKERLCEGACCDFDDDFVGPTDRRRGACAGFSEDVAVSARLVELCALTRAERIIRGARGEPARGVWGGEEGLAAFEGEFILGTFLLIHQYIKDVGKRNENGLMFR